MTCSLCTADAPLSELPVTGGPEASIYVCGTCRDQMDKPADDHFRVLSSTMWSEELAVQVMAARILGRLEAHWARDLLDQLYLDEDTQAWVDRAEAVSAHKDAHGAVLNHGDTVVLIKDLPVKGAGFTAKRGTAVRGISLVADNPAHIEGRVAGQRIVILTEFTKKK